MSHAESRIGFRKLDLESQPDWVKDPFGRGRANEKRALDMLLQMASEGKISHVKRATKKQNTDGIDLWVYIGTEDNELRIPLQVKSSFKAAEDYAKKMKLPYEIAVVVVNEKLSDGKIKRNLRKNIIRWVQHNRAGMAEVVNAPV